MGERELCEGVDRWKGQHLRDQMDTVSPLGEMREILDSRWEQKDGMLSPRLLAAFDLRVRYITLEHCPLLNRDTENS